ncbi:MAG: thioredoxin domain-containing protein [Acidithiobacillales bacterium]
MSEAAGRIPNRLARETSPYLRQHALNPVDWYPWGEEAFRKARQESKPVFLSIGYSSCHWCHVMERESFEDEGIARFLNDHFVPVKVDREERPDVDDVYMTAVQLLTGRGGWPLSAFLLPDRRPFFAGTYFPPDDRHGQPGFRRLLEALAADWRAHRSEIEGIAARLAAEVAASQAAAAASGRVPLSAETLPLLTAALAASFDARRGGFGGAPKFPPHLALGWLLGKGLSDDPWALEMASRTLEAMALGGIHDHLGGGFHRYSTDAEWLVPHFEKMLYDNGQLLGIYARAWAATGRPLFRRTALGIGDDLLREMRGPEGGFFAATDADSEGEEGKYFVWTADEIRRVLGEGDGAEFCEWYGVGESGNFSEEASGRPTGRNILFLSKEPPPEAEARLAPLREALRLERSRRVPPFLDDKRVSGWIALAVSGFATAGRALGEARYFEVARTAARFLLDVMRDAQGRLLRTWKDGAGKIPAFLEDEAYLANALLDLAECVPPSEGGAWLEEAGTCAESLRRRFRRGDGPGFSLSGEGHETLLSASRDLFDKATPSASGSAALALARLARKRDDTALATEAAEAVAEVSWLMTRSPHGTESWFLALEELLAFDREHPEAGVGALLGAAERPALGEGRPGTSLKVKESEENAEALSADGVLKALFPSKVRAKRGEPSQIALTLQVKEGWHLQGEDGIRIEAWGGSDFTLEEIRPRPSHVIPGEGAEMPAFAGTFEESLTFAVSPSAGRGARAISVLLTYRPCGEGACRPEATLSLSVPVEID